MTINSKILAKLSEVNWVRGDYTKAELRNYYDMLIDAEEFAGCFSIDEDGIVKLTPNCEKALVDYESQLWRVIKPDCDDSTPCPHCGENTCDSPYLDGCKYSGAGN